MRWSSARSVLVAAVVLVGASACVRPSVPEVPGGADSRSLADALVERATPFSGRGGLRAGGSLFAYAETAVLVDPRMGLRVDVFTPFMTPAGSLVLTPEGAQYMNRLEGFFVRGNAERLLDTLLDVPVDPAPLPWILAGGIPPAPGEGWTLVPRRAPEPEGALVLQSADASGRVRRAVLEGSDFRLTRFSVFRDAGLNSEMAAIECEKHREGSLPLPMRLKVRAPDRGATLVWRMDEFELGRGPTDEDLVLVPAPGMAVREWR